MTIESEQYNISSGMEEMPSQNMLVQKLKVAVPPMDLPCSGIEIHSVEILTTGKSHKITMGRFPSSNIKKVLQFKYATWYVSGLGEKEE